MIVEIEGIKEELLKFCTFIYDNQTFTIFIHPEYTEESGGPVCYCFLEKDGKYFSIPPETFVKIQPVIYSYISEYAIYNNTKVDFSHKSYF